MKKQAELLECFRCLGKRYNCEVMDVSDRRSDMLTFRINPKGNRNYHHETQVHFEDLQRVEDLNGFADQEISAAIRYFFWVEMWFPKGVIPIERNRLRKSQ